MDLPEIKLFEWFALDQIRPVYLKENGFRVVQFFDMRYGLTPDSLESFWSARVLFDSVGGPPHVAWLQHQHHLTFNRMIAQSWREIWTP